jgi:RimJ/RimL family protein N-acetyltransferase
MTHNERGKALYTRMGFAVEGIKHESLRVDGAWVDEICMAKLLK